MSSDRTVHLSDEQLSQFEDGELGEHEARHVAACPDCSKRLEALRTATRAYIEYRDSIRRPQLPRPPKHWPSLSELVEQHQAKRRWRTVRWWPIAATAAACAVVVLVVMYQASERPSARATELLGRSAVVDLPPQRSIAVRLRGQTLIRPAVLTESTTTDVESGFSEVRSVFIAAHYSWQEPLSARSFQAWRGGLKHKRDSVSIVRGPNDVESYRVRTDAPDSVLQSASLTLRRRDLRPTSASFAFKEVGAVEVGEMPVAVGKGTASPPSVPQGKPVLETPAGPGDTLRVLAALNGIGADVGEPIDVSLDAQHGHVLVRSQGVTAEREQQITHALSHLPHVKLEFSSSGAVGRGTVPDPAEKYSTSVPTPLRTELESKFGSPIALQEVTDHVLDRSASMLAQAHALEVLAVTFPPDMEKKLVAADRALLQSLRENHISELEHLIVQIREDLKPLLSVPLQKLDPSTAREWQREARTLMADAQEADKLLNQLLAGSYSRSAGDQMLRTLPAKLGQLSSAVRLQRNADR